jgi:hypothetical protein
LVRRLISLLIVLAPAAVIGQAFGRFGYTEPTSLPAFLLSHEGFRINARSADTFKYQTSYPDYKPVTTSDTGQTASLSTQGETPRKIKIELTSEGFSLFFESGFTFRVSSMQCPFLSWADGSVGQDVPTPEVEWILVSFRESQPPVLLLFPSGRAAVRVFGTAGNWSIRSVDVAPHWVKIIAPTGTASQSTSTASELGLLVKRVQANIAEWRDPSPQLKSRDIAQDDTSVTATWHFSRSGVTVPPAALYSVLGGYRAQVTSRTKDSGVLTESGPLIVTDEPDLVIRFPVRSIAKGRSVVSAFAASAQPLSGRDIPSLLERAWRNEFAGTSERERRAISDSTDAYIASARDYLEPFTSQKLPFDAHGAGLDVAAAHALLLQASLSADMGSKDQNPLLLSVLLRHDWPSWLLWSDDVDLARRATALASLACLLQGTPEGRLRGAMLEAGLSAQRGLNLWLSHRGMATTQMFLEPLDKLRDDLFFTGPAPEPSAFVKALQSPLRISSEMPVSAVQQGEVAVLSWMEKNLTEKVIQLNGPASMGVLACKNLSHADAVRMGNILSVKALPTDVGWCELHVNLPKGLLLPPYAPPLPYEEVRR